jgi:hypothetical protein
MYTYIPHLIAKKVCNAHIIIALLIRIYCYGLHFCVLGYIFAVSNVYNNNKCSLLFIYFFLFLIFHPRDNYCYYRERLEFKYYSLVTVCLCKPSSLKATVEHLSHRGFRCGRFKTWIMITETRITTDRGNTQWLLLLLLKFKHKSPIYYVFYNLFFTRS